MFNLFQSKPAAAPGMSPTDVVSKAATGELTVIDVRDAGEIARTGKAKGALHIPLVSLQFQCDPKNPDFHAELDTSKPVAIYCASGARSHMAAGIMSRFGFDAVSNLGSLREWSAGGGEVVR